MRNVIAPLADLQGSVNDARAREIALVAEINRRYTPRQILEWHLNTNYYGNEAYGIEAAAQIYLNKRAVDLTLDEAALLAAIPTAPQYNPFANETAARGRQPDLLRAMLNSGMITQDALQHGSRDRHDRSAGAIICRRSRRSSRFTPASRQKHILDSLGYDGTQLIARGSLKITTTPRPRSLPAVGVRAAGTACPPQRGQQRPITVSARAICRRWSARRGQRRRTAARW